MQAIIDADYKTLEHAIAPTKAPRKIINSLALLDVSYYSFDQKLHKGQLVISHTLVEDATVLFRCLLNEKFPIASVKPIALFKNKDALSMKENNSSCFNYRSITGKAEKLSSHAYGEAIDFNPMQNPYIKNNFVLPAGASYNTKAKGTITAESTITKFLETRGWTWGGRWSTLKDYQHFEKHISVV